MLASHIEGVIVFRRGARVTRAATLELDPMPREVRVSGLPLCVDDGSIRARVEALEPGPVPIATGLRVTLDTHAADPALLPADDETLEAAEDALARLVGLMAQTERDLDGLRRLDLHPRGQLEGAPPGPSPATPRRALLSFRAKRRRNLEARRAALQQELRTTTRRVGELRDRDARGSSSRQARAHELRKCVVVALEPVAGERGAARARLVLEYVVPGACWAPSYTLRLDGASEATLELRAQVAQRSGEDWSGVLLTLSTAAADAFTELPELPSRRIGRKQPTPARRGWRPPPLGVEALFVDYERALRRRGERAPASASPQDDELYLARSGGLDGESEGAIELSRMLDAPTGAFPRQPEPAPAPEFASAAAPIPRAPAPQASPVLAARKSSGLLSGLGDLLGGGGPGSGAPLGDAPVRLRSPQHGVEPAPPAEVSTPEPMLDYGRLRLTPPERGGRGVLTLLDQPSLYMELIVTHTAVAALELTNAEVASLLDEARRTAASIDTERMPAGHHLAWSGHYDHAYAGGSRVDVPSDGEFHNVPVALREGSARVVHVVVPREANDVFRVAHIKNPLAAPLMAGPVDVYVGRDYLVTSALSSTPAGGELTVGLGVAQGVKVARNTRYREEATGLMKGTLVLHHEIEIEVGNHSGAPIELEVRERIPTLREGEEDIKLELGEVTPAWEAFDPRPSRDGEVRLRGGYVWRLELADGEQAELSARYALRIAAKHELVGGNRREA